MSGTDQDHLLLRLLLLLWLRWRCCAVLWSCVSRLRRIPSRWLSSCRRILWRLCWILRWWRVLLKSWRWIWCRPRSRSWSWIRISCSASSVIRVWYWRSVRRWTCGIFYFAFHVSLRSFQLLLSQKNNIWPLWKKYLVSPFNDTLYSLISSFALFFTLRHR